MDQLLEKAFDEASLLPAKEKKAFAAFILEELEKDRKWDALYKRSSSELSHLANDALKEYKKGNTEELNTDNL
jgi:hypothetical protein